MPYKYAIAVQTDRYNPRSAWASSARPEYEKDYQPVTKKSAEAHRDGVKQLVTRDGKPLSAWVPVQRGYTPDHGDNKKTSRVSLPVLPRRVQPVHDFMGAALHEGDYVLTSIKGFDELQVCEVIGFVRQGKARVLPLDPATRSYRLLRFPKEMVKISSAVLGPDPNGEWAPPAHEGW